MEKFKPVEWIAIDIASKYGMDKETFEKRLEFGNSLKEELKSTSLEQVVKKYVEEADEPDMFVRALLSMNDVLTTKYTNIPIGIDVSSSGPQIDCTGIRDLDGMVTTGAISEKVPNLYKEIQDEMQLYVPISLINRLDSPFLPLTLNMLCCLPFLKSQSINNTFLPA